VNATDSDSSPHAPDERAIDGRRLLTAARQLFPIACFAIVPAVLLVALIHFEVGRPTPVAFWDFHAFWRAGHAVLHGRSPYPPARASVLAHESSFVYPAPAAIAMAPFALLPFKVSATLFAFILIGSLVLALRLVGVTDWRCYGIALVSAPVENALVLDAISPILALGLALVWRYRDRAIPAACAVAGLVVLKLFLWPFLLWFAFTRRLGTALMAVALIATTSLVSWAIIGFDGFRAYPDVLQILSRLLEGKGYTPVALALSLGAGTTVSRILPLLIGVPALAVLALRGRRPGADAWTFALATGATFALTPIAWLHYFVLLYIPIAIVRPRLSWLWCAPLLLWILGGQSTQSPIWDKQIDYTSLALSPRIGHAPQIIYALVVVTAILLIVGLAARPSRPQKAL
jgi:glycosyl transferase family 87